MKPHHLLQRPRAPAASRKRSFLPEVRSLEDRDVPSSLPVATVEPATSLIAYDTVRLASQTATVTQPHLGPTLVNPVKGSTGLLVSSSKLYWQTADARFGAPRASGTRTHTGIDIAAAIGTNVVAALPGKVILSITSRKPHDPLASNAAGNDVVIESRLSNGTIVRTMYEHLTGKYQPRVGQTIRAGQTIGKVGVTGDVPLHGAPHLHLEMRQYTRGSWVPVCPNILPGPTAGTKLFYDRAWTVKPPGKTAYVWSPQTLKAEYLLFQQHYYNGTYQGSYTGTASIKVGMTTYSQPVNESLRFHVSGKSVTVDVPGTGLGSVFANGGVSVSFAAESVKVIASGKLTPVGASGMTGSGTWSIDDPDISGSGKWTAARLGTS